MATFRSLDDLPGHLPPDTLPPNIDPHSCISFVHTALSTLPDTRESLASDAIWRDWMCFGPHVRTRASAQDIAAAWGMGSDGKPTRSPLLNLRVAESDHHHQPRVDVSRVKVTRLQGCAWVDVPVEFDVAQNWNGLVARCKGEVSLVWERGSGGRGDRKGESRGVVEGWKIWCLVTVLEHFLGYTNPDSPPPVLQPHTDGSLHTTPGGLLTTPLSPGPEPQKPQPHHQNPDHQSAHQLYFSTLILGAGQAGLSLAGRLAALGLSCLVLEKRSCVGARWVRSYDSVRLHTVCEMNNLPFGRTWAAEEGEEEGLEYLTGKQVQRGFERWVERWRIGVWTGAETVGVERVGGEEEKGEDIEVDWTGDRSSAKGEGKRRRWRWRLRVRHEGVEKVLFCRHVVLATGATLNFDRPHVPYIPQSSVFRGLTLHSSAYKNCAQWAGLRAIIVGSATNAHDIAVDMVEAGLGEITMVQRGRTAVYPLETVRGPQRATFNNIPSEIADRAFTRPVKIGSLIVDARMRGFMQSPETVAFFDALEARGFRVDRTARIYDSIAIRGGGYYIDVGASQHIISGHVRVKSGIPIAHFTPSGLAFEDGTRIDADIVVFATGYDEDPVGRVAEILGHDLAGQAPVWGGVDEEGELRGTMREGGVKGLWCHGGSFMQARFWSRFVALQIQADLVGLEREEEMEGDVGGEGTVKTLPGWFWRLIIWLRSCFSGWESRT